jgi:hypothetical protein
VPPRVAHVEGDNVLDRLEEFDAGGWAMEDRVDQIGKSVGEYVRSKLVPAPVPAPARL